MKTLNIFLFYYDKKCLQSFTMKHHLNIILGCFTRFYLTTFYIYIILVFVTFIMIMILL